MTIPFAPEIDVEDFVIAYLSAAAIPGIPAAQISADMPAQLPLPYVLVTRVAGGDDNLVDTATVQLDCFSDTHTASSTVARAVHHVMRALDPQKTLLVDGNVVRIYRCTTEETPAYRPYQPEGGGAAVQRYVSRYRIRVRLPAIPHF